MRDKTAVYHIDKDHVVITPADGWSVTLFSVQDRTIEAVVARDDGSEAIRLHIAPPEAGQHMQIERSQETTEVHIRYSNG